MIYSAPRGLLLAIASRLLGNRGDAEEVVQDTFVTAFEQLRALREPAALRAWLAQITVSLVRRRIRRGRLMRLLGLDRGADDATLAALAAPGPPPISAPIWRWWIGCSRSCARTCASPGCSAGSKGWSWPRSPRIVAAHWRPPSAASPRRTAARRTHVRTARGGRVVSKLRFPLEAGLRDPADEATLSRIWQGIDARLPAPALAAPDRAGGAGADRWRRGALAAVVAVLATTRARCGSPIGRRDRRGRRAGRRARVMSLSDGSCIVLGGRRAARAARIVGLHLHRHLERGNATFDVRPGGPRRWQIECGLATVEVVGTHFGGERARGGCGSRSQRGEVLVRGERVPDRVRRLAAGEALEVHRRNGPVGPRKPNRRRRPRTRRAAPAPVMRAPELRTDAPAVTPRRGWRELARRGRHREAFAALGAQGLRREARRLGVADLFALADVARLSGHPADAVAPLERIVTSFASDRRRRWPRSRSAAWSWIRWRAPRGPSRR